MNAADTSVLVAAFASWHPGHAVATSALTAAVGLPEHVVIETYSVLTRLPPPHRVSPSIAARWLDERFSATLLRPAPDTVASLPSLVATLDIKGGSVYDALIGLTVRDAGADLLTRDERAARTYDRLDVAYTLLR